MEYKRIGGYCIKKLCGNGKIDEGEQCDDGNSEDGDGCSSSLCLI